MQGLGTLLFSFFLFLEEWVASFGEMKWGSLDMGMLHLEAQS